MILARLFLAIFGAFITAISIVGMRVPHSPWTDDLSLTGIALFTVGISLLVVAIMPWRDL